MNRPEAIAATRDATTKLVKERLAGIPEAALPKTAEQERPLFESLARKGYVQRVNDHYLLTSAGGAYVLKQLQLPAGVVELLPESGSAAEDLFRVLCNALLLLETCEQYRRMQ